MQTPNITPAQIAAAVQMLIGVAIAFGLPVSDAQSTAIVGMVTVFASVLLVSDAHIRRGRAKVAEAQQYAEAQQAMLAPRSGADAPRQPGE